MDITYSNTFVQIFVIVHGRTLTWIVESVVGQILTDKYHDVYAASEFIKKFGTSDGFMGISWNEDVLGWMREHQLHGKWDKPKKIKKFEARCAEKWNVKFDPYALKYVNPYLTAGVVHHSMCKDVLCCFCCFCFDFLCSGPKNTKNNIKTITKKITKKKTQKQVAAWIQQMMLSLYLMMDNRQ